MVWAFCVLVVVFLFYVSVLETRRLKVNNVTVNLPRLPLSLDGLTVAVLGDLHVRTNDLGCRISERAIAAVNALRPDIVCVVGDMVHWGSGADRAVALLSRLQANFGVFACLGNHDHNCAGDSKEPHPWGGPVVGSGEWKKKLDVFGITCLVNEAVAVNVGDGCLWVSGVDDPHTGRDDLKKALTAVGGERPCLMLAHSPDIVDDPGIGCIDLVLSGHTHGGQVVLPLLGPFMAPCRYPRKRGGGGLRTVNGTNLFVTRGLWSALWLRFNCPPEVALLTLRTPRDAI